MLSTQINAYIHFKIYVVGKPCVAADTDAVLIRQSAQAQQHHTTRKEKYISVCESPGKEVKMKELLNAGWTTRCKVTMEGQFCQLSYTRLISTVQQSLPKGFQCHRLMVSITEIVLRRADNT